MKATDNLFVSTKLLGNAAVALKHLVDNASTDKIGPEDVKNLTIEERDALTLFLTLVAPVKKAEPVKKADVPDWGENLAKTTKYVKRADEGHTKVRIKK